MREYEVMLILPPDVNRSSDRYHVETDAPELLSAEERGRGDAE